MTQELNIHRVAITSYPFHFKKSIINYYRFMTNWNTFGPKEYLTEYYLDLDLENRKLLNFYATVYTKEIENCTFLEFGCGPTIYSVITASKHVKDIHLSDGLKRNLNHIEKWLKGSESTIWDGYIKYSLKEEGSDYSPKEIKKRSELLRSKAKIAGKCNAFSTPLIPNGLSSYDVVATNFCPESITNNKLLWKKALKNIFSLLRPGGLGVITSLSEANFYYINEKKFPATFITQQDLIKELLHLGFLENSISTNYIKTDDSRGYRGIIMVAARKRKI